MHIQYKPNIPQAKVTWLGAYPTSFKWCVSHDNIKGYGFTIEDAWHDFVCQYLGYSGYIEHTHPW